MIYMLLMKEYIDGLAQSCSKSSALAMELLHSCTKPSVYEWYLILSLSTENRESTDQSVKFCFSLSSK